MGYSMGYPMAYDIPYPLNRSQTSVILYGFDVARSAAGIVMFCLLTYYGLFHFLSQTIVVSHVLALSMKLGQPSTPGYESSASGRTGCPQSRLIWA